MHYKAEGKECTRNSHLQHTLTLSLTLLLLDKQTLAPALISMRPLEAWETPTLRARI
jgi:hypothetical protein